MLSEPYLKNSEFCIYTKQDKQKHRPSNSRCMNVKYIHFNSQSVFLSDLFIWIIIIYDITMDIILSRPLI